MKPGPGTRLGPYELVSRLGAGGMGEVWRARDTRLPRDVAVKILPAHLASDSGRRARLEREAAAIAKLSHPHICALYDVGRQDDRFYLVMELVDGETLGTRLRRGPLPLDEALRIGIEIAEALESAHGAGVVHRDLKPGNVMLTGTGAKLLDFGLARSVARGKTGSDDTTATADAPLTRDGVVIGTVQYMAPEQLQGRRVDHRADIFALGLVLKEMVPRPPPLLDRVIKRCLRPRPEDRWQSAHEIANALRGVGRRARPWRAAAAAVLVIVAVFGLWVAWSHRPRSTAIRSLAILPFKPVIAGNRATTLELLITNALIARSGGIRGLVVRPLGAVRRFGGIDQDPVDAGRILGVDAVLDGNIVTAARRVQVTARLIRVSDAMQLWHREFTNDFADQFSLSDEVSTQFANDMAEQLSGTRQQRPRTRDTANAEAYRAYVVGRVHLGAVGGDELRTAIAFFQRAIRLDPDYAPAHAALAFAYATLPIGADEQSRPAAEASRTAAAKALALDPENSDAHMALGDERMWCEWDWIGAETELRRAIALNPSNATAHYIYSHLLLLMRRESEQQHEAREALRLDPGSILIANNAGSFAARSAEETIAACRRALEINPDFWIAHQTLGGLYARRGMPDLAEQEWRAAWAHSGGTTEPLARLGQLLATRGDRAGARKIIDEMHSIEGQRYVPPVNFAVVYSALGNRDQAFAYLRRACSERDVRLVFLQSRDEWSPLRFDPRFAEIERCVNLPASPPRG